MQTPSPESVRSRSTAHFALSCFGVVAFAAGCAQAPKPESKPPEPAQIEQTVSATAKVVSVEQSTRLLVLRNEAGQTWLVRAGEQVRNFAQIQRGDTVRVDFTTALAVALAPADETPAEATLGVAAGRAKPGEEPAAAIAAQLTLTVRIESIDTEHQIVAFTPPGGRLEVVRVRTPEGQQFLRGLKVGERVKITYTECMAVAVEKQ